MTDLLTTAQAAELAGMTPASWRKAVTRSAELQAARVRIDGRTPAWPRAVVTAWLASRPGRGARNDIS